MNENQVEEIKKILTEWDPLKTAGKTVKDLDNYNTEAIDFLFHASKSMTKQTLANLAIEIIEQAFEVLIENKLTDKLGQNLHEIVHKY